MNIIDAIVIPSIIIKNRYDVEFVADSGNRVSVQIDDSENAPYDELKIIQSALDLLQQTSSVEGTAIAFSGRAARILEPMDAHQADHTPSRLTGPTPPKNPLVDDGDEEANIIRVKGEGMIDP